MVVPPTSSATTTRPRITATDRRILALAVPALGSLAVEPLYVLVDTAIVGRLGTEQLGGLAVAATVLSFVVAGLNFLTYGTTERVARRIGQGNATASADVGVQAMWIAVLVGVPVAVVIGFGASPIARALGADRDVLGYAATYLRISALAVPFIVITLAAQGVLRGGADYRTPLAILLTANLANAALEPWMVFGLDLGVPGSAWSTVICQVAAALAFVWVIRRRLALATHRRPQWDGMAPLLRAGRHLLLRVGSMLAVLGGATAVAARIDEPTLAAHQVVSSMFILVALVLDALAVPAQTLVAEQLGRGLRADAAELASRAVRLSVVAAVVLAGVLALSAPFLPNAFTTDDAVASRATSALLILAVALVPAAIAFAHDGVLIGAADYRFLGRAALGYLLAVAPIGAAVLAAPALGIAGIWIGLGIWMTIRAVVNDRRTRYVLGPASSRSRNWRP
jgi:putative MATE family efflux protein